MVVSNEKAVLIMTKFSNPRSIDQKSMVTENGFIPLRL
jgi:hypothetical protein